MADQEEIRLRGLDAEAVRILGLLQASTSKQQIEHYVGQARRVVQTANAIPIVQHPARFQQHIKVTSSLQRVAYHDPDSGGVRDIAEWCLQRWLRLQQLQSDTWEVYKGLGQAWLFKSQIFLARIHQIEASTKGKGKDDEGALHSPNHVEARATLVPATEHFSRAASVLERKGAANGELLALCAEAFMSLGNISYSRTNETYFVQAVQYLRKASKIPGYRLPPHMQQ
ncbi:hypothetical protein AJ79_03195 [Helicocarpus griseus UAMH5409]|uniref:Uncharacterized protein n=1 Tax=Helicocarpus griseus UAMH5409 TaxID=1447875 RepID=A0A2B7Y028_9EURO|nr:hypothetical protein AJ79_03195 [Helicocarpus griseus UAMH5409]